MKNSLFFILLIATISIAIADQPQPIENKVVTIINSHNSQQSISQNGLGAVFKMRLRRWQNGVPITVFVINDKLPLHQQFCKKILNVFPHQMRRVWDKAVFSGAGQAPIQLENEQAMLKKISSTPGAIGYLNSTHLTDKVKILEVQ